MARLHPLRRRSSSPYNHNHTLPSPARFFIMALITIAILLSDASPAEGQWQLSNGLISLQVGFPTACGRQVFPSITALSVMGDLLVPPYCDGALFQMTSRSIQGNDYNPTQVRFLNVQEKMNSTEISPSLTNFISSCHRINTQ
jgi:hypothetical protein